MLNNQFTTKRTSLFLIFYFLFLILLNSCSTQKEIARSAKTDVLETKALQSAHVGISIFDPAENKWLYNYQGDKYFVPASNTKIPTCYAAMKYLGDSLVGLRYKLDNGEFIVQGTGDPTFLNSEFKDQPVFDFISKMSLFGDVRFSASNWQEEHLGSGWSWNDYNEYYMTERSPFPIYGNVVKFYIKDNKLKSSPSSAHIHLLFQVDGLIAYPIDSITDEYIDIKRNLNDNFFHTSKSKNKFKEKQIPFSTQGYITSTLLLNDTLHPKTRIYWQPEELASPISLSTIHSQPTDSLLKPMMHRSDNFFAEQSLLMVSNERLGVMSDEKIIDTLLKTDFKDLPQKPRWADGSGLSRYNLFTPQDLVAILNKMKNEFGMERIKVSSQPAAKERSAVTTRPTAAISMVKRGHSPAWSLSAVSYIPKRASCLFSPRSLIITRPTLRR